MPLSLVEAAEIKNDRKHNLANRTIRGRVHNNGSGIGGVAVTDGLNMVVTDKNGRYELLSNRRAEFVYISIPS